MARSKRCRQPSGEMLGASRNPGPIRVTLQQDGRAAKPASIDPDKDLTIAWTPFFKGAADPNGIIDDMIYVMMGDCLGNETVHSGHAISDADALTYRASQFVIPAEKLFPGRPFQLEIEHSNMDTDVWKEIEKIVTYAATTFLDIQDDRRGRASQRLSGRAVRNGRRTDGSRASRRILTSTPNIETDSKVLSYASPPTDSTSLSTGTCCLRSVREWSYR